MQNKHFSTMYCLETDFHSEILLDGTGKSYYSS